jgi:alpha-aminoadipic semialdehyde synthase
LPYFTVLVNCIYWDARYPRFVTKGDLAALYGGPSSPRLRVIGDISCDVEGGIEATVKGTTPDSPVYVYDVERRRAVDGVAGTGPVILAVFNLPAEIPRDASAYFGRQLEPYVAPLARVDWDVGFSASELPAPVKAATILYRGEFTPQYRYLERYLA